MLQETEYSKNSTTKVNFMLTKTKIVKAKSMPKKLLAKGISFKKKKSFQRKSFLKEFNCLSFQQHLENTSVAKWLAHLW